MTQMIEPIAIAPVMPAIPVLPVAFSTNVEISRVAIAIPETGLLELPIRPTILEDTVAKKKPKIAIRNAPRRLTGTDGTSQIRMITIRMIPRTTGIFMSRSVRTFVPPDVFFRLFIAPANVFMISGRDFRRLITPPVAIAPAPTYLITLDQIALAPFAS